jgi:sialidase-1
MSNQTVLQLDPTPANSRNSEGAFITLKDGSILFAYTKYEGDFEDDGHAVIASRISHDQGRTWSTNDRTLIPQEGDLNVMSVTFLRLQDGRIALFNLRKDHGPHGHICIPWVRFSSDEAQSFTKPLNITAQNGYYVLNNDRVIQLASGRLVAPLALHRMRGATQPGPNSSPEIGFAHAATIFFYLSDDGGQHWYESQNSLFPYSSTDAGLQEPGVVELASGQLLAYCRAGAFGIAGSQSRQWLTTSDNQGVNWSDPKPSDNFISPCSPLSIKRIPSTGHLLAVWNDHAKRFPTQPATDKSWGRTPLVSAISTDEGKTWQHHKLLEDAPDHGFCYIAIHFTSGPKPDDNAVLLAYCAGGASTKLVLDRLRLRRITLNELYGG